MSNRVLNLKANFTTTANNIEEGSYEFISRISDSSADLHDEIVDPRGMRTPKAGMPILLFHDDTRPVGKVLWIKQGDGEVISRGKININTEDGKLAWELIKGPDQFVKDISIGFKSFKQISPSEQDKRSNEKWKNVDLVHSDWLPLEYSIVSIGANRNAEILEVAKSHNIIIPKNRFDVRYLADEPDKTVFLDEQEKQEDKVELKKEEKDFDYSSLIKYVDTIDVDSIVKSIFKS